MIGGLFKSTSRFALIAAAGVIAGSVGAQAADLGGNCCADLEERVAELEATTARKGNRRVSLTVSGQVNEAVLFWDDGSETNAYVGTNSNSRTRFRFVGDAKISADWSAGYLLEIGVRAAAFEDLSQRSDDGARASPFDLRHSAWWIDSKTYGRVWVGQTSNASDGITEINLSNGGTLAGSEFVGTAPALFNLRPSGSAAGLAGLSGLTWRDIGYDNNANPGETGRFNLVRYVSPTLAGFIFSAAWGEDDFWDVALRYAGEFGGFRVAAGIGYLQANDAGIQNCANLSGAGLDTNVDCHQIGLSGSIMHVATGLYIHGAYGELTDENRRALFGRNVKDTDDHWYVQGGIEQKFFGLGKTTILGEYFQGNAGAGMTAGLRRDVLAADTINLSGADAQIGSTELEFWGVGIVQNIEAAAMDLYLGYRSYSADVKLVNGLGDAVDGRSLEDFQMVTAGAIIRF